jgi:hypothetical protein
MWAFGHGRLKCGGEFLRGEEETFCGGGDWHPDGMGKPYYGVGDPFSTCGSDPHAVAAIVIHCGTQVPSGNCVWGVRL